MLAQSDFPKQTYTLGVRAFGALRFDVNGTQVGEITLSAADQTKFGAITKQGLYASAESGARFDNLAMMS